MDVDAARALACKLINQHGLTDWQFQFDRARRRFGCCWAKRKLITLSRPLTELNDIADVTDTVLHEIAHALVPGGHTPAWRRMCVALGAKPRRCFSSTMVRLPEIRNKHLYIANCRCPTQHIRKRRPKTTALYVCRRCKKPLDWSMQKA
jgi:predicted SprT family Zn-dependent metalloprotease